MNWKRTAVGACTAAVLVAGAGLAFAPAANAATDPTTGVVGGVASTLSGIAPGALGGTTGSPSSAVATSTPSATPTGGTTPTSGTTPITPITVTAPIAPTTAIAPIAPVTASTPIAPVTASAGADGIAVGLGTSTGGTSAGDTPLVSTPLVSTPAVGVQVGGVQVGGVQVGDGTVAVSAGATASSTSTTTGTSTATETDTTGTGGVSGTAATSGTGTTATTGTTGAVSGTIGTPVTLAALSATAQYATVYPARDGYRDSEVFTLNGITSDGQQHPASGAARLTYGSRTVDTWPITATGQTMTWDGRLGGRIVPGRYILSATIVDSTGAAVSGQVAVDVSAKRLATTTTMLSARAVSGTHRMAVEPRTALAQGAVTLRLTSVASHVRGKQYLVFTHAGWTLRIRIRNGKHTSGAVTIPRSFTSFTISHTWRKSSVRISSLQYRYSYRTLR